MLTIFGNLKINSEAKLQHLKDSFFSFSEISDDWLINIRGDFRAEAVAFLKKELGDKAHFFELLDDARGWTANALEMLPEAKYDYVLVWNEDHMNIAPQSLYGEIIEEMRANRVEYMPYSWWFTGTIRNKLGVKEGKNIDVVYLTEKKWKPIIALEQKYYIIHLTGIFSKTFFEKLLKEDKGKSSISIVNFFAKLTNLLGIRSGREKWFNLVNKLFFRRKLRKFSPENPFGLEYESHRTDILPVETAFPKRELFACIDDDSIEKGYQLIKRGLYPPDYRLQLGLAAKSGSPERAGQRVKEINLSSGEVYEAKHVEDGIRTKNLIEEKIFIKSGRVSVGERGKSSEVNGNSFVGVYPNVGYTIKALKDSSVEIIFPEPAASMKNIKNNVAQILKEISFVFSDIRQDQVDALVEEIIEANKIVVCGAGRVGMAVRGFGMRLGHLGLPASSHGETTAPAIGPGGLFLVASGSGETQTIAILVEIAKKNKARIALVTGNPESRMGKLADVIVHIKAPSKTKPVKNFLSIQPMTTLNEQCLGIFFDALVLQLMERLGETHETMWERHSNLE